MHASLRESQDAAFVHSLMDYVRCEFNAQKTGKLNNVTADLLRDCFKAGVSSGIRSASWENQKQSQKCDPSLVFPNYYGEYRDVKDMLHRSIYDYFLQDQQVQRRVILSGVTAAGKTTFFKCHPEGMELAKNPTVLFDEYAVVSENDFRLSLKTEKPLDIKFIYRDIVTCADAYKKRALEEQTYKTPKEFTLKEKVKDFVDSHIEKIETFVKLMDKQKNTMKIEPQIYYNHSIPNTKKIVRNAAAPALHSVPSGDAAYSDVRRESGSEKLRAIFHRDVRVIREADNAQNDVSIPPKSTLTPEEKAAHYQSVRLDDVKEYLGVLKKYRTQCEMAVSEIFEGLRELYPSPNIDRTGGGIPNWRANRSRGESFQSR